MGRLYGPHLSPRLRKCCRRGWEEWRMGRCAVKGVCWRGRCHYTHELTAALVTHTRSSQHDQLTFRQAAVIGLSGLKTKQTKTNKSKEIRKHIVRCLGESKRGVDNDKVALYTCMKLPKKTIYKVIETLSHVMYSCRDWCNMCWVHRKDTSGEKRPSPCCAPSYDLQASNPFPQ